MFIYVIMKEGFEIGKGVIMFKLGIIGIGVISYYFIEAVYFSGEYKLVVIYFRKLEIAVIFVFCY